MDIAVPRWTEKGEREMRLINIIQVFILGSLSLAIFVSTIILIVLLIAIIRSGR